MSRISLLRFCQRCFLLGLIGLGILYGCSNPAADQPGGEGSTKSSGNNSVDIGVSFGEGSVQGFSELGDTLTTPVMRGSFAIAVQDSFLQAMKQYRIDPENQSYFLALATATTATGNFREALTLYAEGVFKFPEDPRVFLGRSHVWMQLRDFQRAQNDLEIAMDRVESATELMDYHAGTDPDGTIYREILHQRTFLHILEEEYEDAAGLLSELLEFVPNQASEPSLPVLFWAMIVSQQTGDDSYVNDALAMAKTHSEYNLRSKKWQQASPQTSLWMSNPAFFNQNSALYADLFALFAGEAEPDALWNRFYPADQTTKELLHHGLAYWHLYFGREEQAIFEWQSIIDTSEVPFGHLYLLAETNLAKLRQAS